MCGIAGIYRQDQEHNLVEGIKIMLDAIKYRGPDQQGIKVFDQCVIGANRLSIIDIQKGDQPIHNEDDSIWIVYNGEIYNFRELRETLIKHGHVFYTNTDTEVVVHLYEQEGIDGFEKLNGMFAFAIYDLKQKRLIIARDKIGIKPLYYSLSNGIVFASEMKALLALRDINYHLNLLGVYMYFMYDYTPCPSTVVKEIHKLKPGTSLIVEQGQIYEKKFSSINFKKYGDNTGDEKAIKGQLDIILHDSVKAQMIADVPVGIFLSGGIDSSTIAYYASRISPDIKTFSISFDEPSFDESRYAQLVSKHLGLRHYSAEFNFELFKRLYERLTDFMDEPVADPSFLPTYFLSTLASEYVKVVLSGEGGDEMFAGYPTYIAHRFADVYNKIPSILKLSVIEPLIKMLPVSSKNFSFDFVAKRFIKGVNLPVHKRHIEWMGGFSQQELSLLLKDGLLQQTSMDFYDPAKNIITWFNTISDPELANMLDILLYLPDDLLVKADRTTMFASIEARVPLLDNRLIDFSMSLPFNYKIRGFTQKYIVKALMKDRLPDVIINRKKKGFGIPVARWLRKEFRYKSELILSKDAIEPAGLFNYEYVHRLLKEHVTGMHDHRKKIWSLLVFVGWLQKNNLKV
ncbi:MAG: asparagine synthase (glutamine-hydrolyzing) [bacterium]